jgi:hypothetical protein
MSFKMNRMAADCKTQWTKSVDLCASRSSIKKDPRLCRGYFDDPLPPGASTSPIAIARYRLEALARPNELDVAELIRRFNLALPQVTTSSTS